jgi:hypothetical protein
MKEQSSVEFDNNLAKSMPDFGLARSKYDKISQSFEIENTVYNEIVESESKVIKQLKERKKKQQIYQKQLQHFQSKKKPFSNKIRSDHLPMIRESTEFLDFSTDGTKYNLMKHTSLKLPRLACNETSLTETSTDTASFETETSLPEISIRRISNYIPTIHLDHPEKHYQSYSRFIHSFKNRYSDSNKNIDAINGTQFKLEPITKKINKRIDSSVCNQIQNRSSKIFP